MAERNFEGHPLRECGEHRTVGPHRAWCYDCQEWCYPSSPCARCEAPKLRNTIHGYQLLTTKMLESSRPQEGPNDEDGYWVPAAYVDLIRALNDREPGQPVGTNVDGHDI